MCCSTIGGTARIVTIIYVIMMNNTYITRKTILRSTNISENHITLSDVIMRVIFDILLEYNIIVLRNNNTV